MIIEDEMTRTKEFREKRLKRVEMLKAMNAPAAIIEYEEELAKMSYKEFMVYLDEEEKRIEQKKKDYLATHKVDEKVVKKLFARFDELMAQDLSNHKGYCDCATCFCMLFDPLRFMSQDDFDMGLYDMLLDSFQDQINIKMSSYNG